MKTPKSFEEGIARLEEILALIAEETTPLSQSVKLYAEAATVLAYCNETLASAKLQIEEIDVKLNASALNAAEDDIL